MVSAERLERWQRIAREAAEQCERGRLPRVKPPLAFGAALQVAAARGPVLLAWERQMGGNLAETLASLPAPGLALFVGPEGGYTADEVTAARTAGAHTVSLGRASCAPGRQARSWRR